MLINLIAGNFLSAEAQLAHSRESIHIKIMAVHLFPLANIVFASLLIA